MTACRRIRPLLEAYVDGELSPEKSLEIDQHFVDCEVCCERARLMGAIRVSVRRVVRATPDIDALQSRITHALAEESKREQQQWSRFAGKPLSWRGIAAFSAAAGVLLAIGAVERETILPFVDDEAASERPERSASSLKLQSSALAMQTGVEQTEKSVEDLIEQFLDHHTRQSDPEVTEPALLEHLEPQVGVPVPMPSLQQYGASWEGASVVPVRKTHAAASLRYRIGGHRVTLYVYNSQHFPLRIELEPQVVRNAPVYVGTRRGYSIAAIEQRGVGYAIATDLKPLESAELVASIH